MNKKDKWILALILIIVGLCMAIAKWNHFRASAEVFGQKIEFQSLDDGAKFKSPVGADVTVKVASADMVVITSVEQEGKDTVIRLSPVAKK